MLYPVVKQIEYSCALKIFAKLRHLPGAVLLHSSQQIHNFGEYSFIGVDPFLVLNNKKSPVNINTLRKILQMYKINNIPELAPLQGGLIGFLSYELLHQIETNISNKQINDLNLPDILLGAYDLVIAFSHNEKKTWIFSSGLPATTTSNITARAQKRMNWILEKVVNKNSNTSIFKSNSLSLNFNKINSNFTKSQYIRAVNKFKEYILAGDIFEANLTQRFSTYAQKTVDPFYIYTKLCNSNPAAFSAFFNLDDIAIISISPERFIRLQDRSIETYPIKGTAARSSNPLQDKILAQNLLKSEKDIAENIMIVDLMRNDLSKVCEPLSVNTPYVCELQSFPNVHHLVSKIVGTLANELTAIDLIYATFPGGSITGAPKVRAMQIINEVEPHVRGVYCGSIGYIGFDNTLDLSIAIRTMVIKNNHITYNAGGAITYDSDPICEYNESLTKVQAFKNVLNESSKKFINTN